MSDLDFKKYCKPFEVHKSLWPEIFYPALEYKPRSGDIFLATFPKCGTNWATHILLLLLREGKPFDSPTKFHHLSPFLEQDGIGQIENIEKPRLIRTHLPFNMMPWSEKAKYIYVSRNVKDCCVSFYHFSKSFPGFNFQGNFDEFFDLFIEGKILFGDFFDHLLSWYPQRHKPNVLFLSFEDLKNDFDSTILKIASFLFDSKFVDNLKRDPDVLSNIKKYSSVKEMGGFLKERHNALKQMTTQELANLKISKAVQLLLKSHEKEDKEGNKESDINKFTYKLVRKGVVGDWKNSFSEEQNSFLQEKIAERLKGTEFLELWKN